MVVILCPATRETGATHERIASPFRWTVQAPHWAMPQPYLVPVRPRFSRNTHGSGVDGSTSTLTGLLLTVNEITLTSCNFSCRKRFELDRVDERTRARAGSPELKHRCR